MSLRTSNDYHLHFPYSYISPSCDYYYLNPTHTYQPPILLQNSFSLSDEQIQLRHSEISHRHKKRHGHSNVPTKQPYQSINSIDTTPTIPNDQKMSMDHRSDSATHMRQQQFVKQNSLQKSSMIFLRSETVDDSQRTELFPSINDYYHALKDLSAANSNKELTHLLDRFTSTLKHIDNVEQQQQQLSIVIDILNALINVRLSVLISVSQHEFFSIPLKIFIHVIRQWHHRSSLQENKFLIFRIMTKLIEKLITNIDDVKLLPSWLTDSSLLDAISNCLINIVASEKFLHKTNKSLFKHLTRLIETYTLYQQRLNHPHKDALVQLLDPILHCLTSSQFIHTLTNVPVNARSMTTIEKLFLVKCSAFLTSYNGSRLEQTMGNLLTLMLPQYVKVLDQLVLSAHQWKRSVIRSVHYLLQVINHGANQFQTNAKLVSGHLSLIDDVLRLVNEPILYNNLQETLSNVETTLMNTAISFLVNMISEPSILAHMKQSQVASIFLRLTTGTYKPLVFNVNTLLAYTTHEEDIKAIHDPGRLLTTTIESLKVTLYQKYENETEIEQLLETLKGLVQHDQIKDEIIKQNALPFLLECTKKLTKRALVLIFEILWCLAFFIEIADILRADSEFLSRIRTTSQDNTNEPLRKAAEGLVWKLIQEPTSLEKVAQLEEVETEEIITTAQTVAGESGQEQVVRTKRRGSTTPHARAYHYDIMISYCHADKEVTYKIHKFLTDQGFKIWIDLDNMYGPAMNAMADAVENSEFVVMCMSDFYKQSTYCQAEAEYAFKCKRRLIPLIVRQDYKPDGWLGFMIGSRIYVDFGRFDFDTACEKLMTEISLQKRETKLTVPINPLDHQKPVDTRSSTSQPVETKKKLPAVDQAEKPVVKKNLVSSVFKARQAKLDFIRKPITQWIEADVLDFLLAHRLNQLKPLCEAMNGRALIQLYKICASRPLRAYSVLKDELKTKDNTNLSLSVYSQFLSITEEVIKSQPTPTSPSPRPPVLSMNNLPETLTNIPFKLAPDLDTSYDFSIITNASALDTLKMVESFGPELQILDSLRRRVTSVF